MAGHETLNSKVKISAVVVVYNDYQSLNILIKSLCDQVDMTVVIDNSSIDHVVPEHILKDKNIVYHRMDRNKGLGAGLNKGIYLSENSGADWVLLLDQDSVVSENMICSMLNEYDRRIDQEKISLICPDVFLQGEGSRQYPLYSGMFLIKRLTETSDKADFAITSGSMIKMSLFKEIGFMDEQFFIDYIDYDFCLRLRSEGYKILYVREAVLTHELGERKVSDIGIKYTGHAPERIYYQTRNRLSVVQRYGVRFPSFAMMQILLFLLKFFKIILVEDRKILRLQYYFKGISDFFRKQYSLT